MSDKRYKTKDWYTSQWNFADDVVSTQSFADEIKLHDVSLRDGEQQAGLVFNKGQKIALAEKMAEMGIHRIEAGMPAVSAQDAAAITEIAKRDLGSEIFAFCRCMKDDVKRAVDCGVKNIVIEIPASDHIVEHAYKWEMQRAMDLSIEATQFAKENGLYTVFFPIDGTRAEISSFLDLIQMVEKEGHMDALAVVDTFGGLAPHSCGYLIRQIKKRIDKPLEVHFHDDFGLASANTIMALAAGAQVAHTTISGIGERAGNAPYEDIVMALLTMYNIDVGIKFDKIYSLSKHLRKISGLNIRQNRGIIGDDIHKIESGIIADWYNNARDVAPLELSPYLYPLTGHPDYQVVIGKNSGITSVDIWLKAFDMDPISDDDLKMDILLKIKDKSFAKGGLIDKGEFVDIVNEFVSK